MATDHMRVQAGWSVRVVRIPNDERKEGVDRLLKVHNRGEIWRELLMKEAEEGGVGGEGKRIVSRGIKWIDGKLARLNLGGTELSRIRKGGLKINKVSDELREGGGCKCNGSSGSLLHRFILGFVLRRRGGSQLRKCCRV